MQGTENKATGKIVKADINAGDVNGATPLHMAAECFSKAGYNTLIKLGADTTKKTKKGVTAKQFKDR